MKIAAFVFFFGICLFPLFAQNITATTPARLRVYASKPDGAQAVVTSENLSVSYDQLKMTGQLMLSTLVTDDENFKQLLDSTLFDKIEFFGLIPEGQFAFQSMLNAKFSVETDIFYGDYQGKILIDFDVSNRNTSLTNTFDITCTGSVSLIDDLGITRDTGLDDKVSFQFFQNVIVRNY